MTDEDVEHFMKVRPISPVSSKLPKKEPEEAKKPPAPPRVIKTAVADIPLQDYQITVMTRGIVNPDWDNAAVLLLMME